ncbi:MAG: response regulator transcription factor [Planctomycetes bacterium]|nr:response regulator transcription factor [Planctomycetota bacterium]MCB9886073.1 response regulator transcription factor [Planctomycetota bacterium]
MNQLLVVEDDASIRESLVDFFTAREWLVTAAGGVRAAQDALAAQRFHMVLLDLRLPDGEGLDVLRTLRRAGDRTPVIVLTARGEVDQRVLGLSVGADDYVTKPFSVHELAARIVAVQRRTEQPASAVLLGDAEVDLAGHEVRRDGQTFRLLPKEAELLAHLLRHRGQACSRDDLLRAVWGYDATPTTRTVDTHVFQLRKKIEADPSAPAWLQTVHGVGYRLVP